MPGRQASHEQINHHVAQYVYDKITADLKKIESQEILLEVSREFWPKYLDSSITDKAVAVV